LDITILVSLEHDCQCLFQALGVMGEFFMRAAAALGCIAGQLDAVNGKHVRLTANSS
jgi:hypothetical protein